MNKREQKVFFGNLDFDNDPRYVKSGDYSDIRNFRGSRTDSGNDGTIENVKSLNEVTELVDNTGSTVTLPDGVNKCIGTHTSDSTSRSFMFIWNSEGEHTIWEYSFKQDKLILLVQDKDWTSSLWFNATAYTVGDVVNLGGSANYVCTFDHTSSAASPNNSPTVNSYYWKDLNEYLGFGEFDLIYDVVELTRDGDTLLIWTDGENEVKYINVDRLKRTSGDVYPTPYEEEYFDLIPTTPQLGIPIYDTITEYIDGANVSSNTITGTNDSILRKSKPFIYYDNGNTTITGLTNGTIYYVADTGSSGVAVSTTQANAEANITIPITAGAGVQSLVALGTLTSSGDDEKPNSLVGRYFQFRYQWEYADGMKSPWSPISKTVGSIASIKMKTGSKDILKIQVPNQSNGGSSSYCKKIYVAVREVGDNNTGDFYTFKEIDATDTTQSDDDRLSELKSLYGYGTTSGGDQYGHYYEYDFHGDEPKLAIDVNELNQLFSWLPKSVRSLSLVGDNRLFVGNTLEGNDVGDIDKSSVTQTPTFQLASFNLDLQSTRTIKRGANQKYGVIYSDEKGRVSSVIPFDNEVTVPWYEATMSNVKIGALVQLPTEFDITPPSWAKYYQIVSSKNRSYDVSSSSNERFLQIQAFNPAITYNPDGRVSMSVTLDYIDNFNSQYTDNNSAVLYDFVKGDSVRLIFKQFPADYFGEFAGTAPIYQGTIESYDSASNRITFDYTIPAGAGETMASGDWIEIFSPAKQQGRDEDLIWYEIGETFRIGKDVNEEDVHYAITDRPLISENVDQVLGTTDADVCISGGDCWLYPRTSAREKLFGDGDYDAVAAAPIRFEDPSGHGFYDGQEAIITWGGGTLTTTPATTSGDTVLISVVSETEFDITISSSPFTVIDFTSSVDPTTLVINITGWETFSVESPYIEDFVPSKSSDIGRANIVTDEGLKEISREATARIGQPYVPNTDINNIGFFYDIDFSEYNKNYGSIQKLYTDTHNVNLFQETKFGTIPVNRTLIEDLEGQGLMGLASDLLGKIKYSEEDYGISTNGESHISYGSNQFWVDANRNAVCQLSPQGFRVISDLNTTFYFDQLFQTIQPYSNAIKLIGGYDREFDEYLLTFDVRLMPSNPSGISYSGGAYTFSISDSSEESAWFNVQNGAMNSLTSIVNVDGSRAILRYYDTVDGYYKEVVGGFTLPNPTPYITGIGTGLNIDIVNENVPYAFFRDCIAFSPKSNGWSSRYDFECDWWSNHGNKLASIKDGRFYKHNDIALSPVTYGDFYGTQYEGMIEFPFNEDAVLKKQPLAMEIESNNGEWYVEEAVNNQDQTTNIPNNYFDEREGEYYAPILRDTNTPNKTYPLLDGWKMVGSYLKVKLKNDSTDLVNLFSSSLNYMFSKYR